MYLLTLLATLTLNTHAATPLSFNPDFLGIWEGKAPTKKLCSGGRDKVRLTLEKPDVRPEENMRIILKADWGCFAEMEIPGYVFGNEFWGSTEDRLTFVKLKLSKSKSLAGEFRFDLNGHALKMDFSKLKKAGP